MEFLRLLTTCVFTYIAISFFGSIWLGHKSFEFRVGEVETVAQASSELSPQGVREQFRKNHDQVLPEKEFSALSLSTGGIRGSIHLLYGSLSEFLAVYHAPLQTGGSSGRHFMNMSITVLNGSIKVWNEKSGNYPVKYSAGDHYAHRIGERTFVELENNTYLLIYGRGLVPMTMGYWIWDSLFSAVDPASAFLTITYYFRAVYSSMALREFFTSLYNSAWMLASNGVSYPPILWENIQNFVSQTLSHVFQGSKSIMTDT